MTNNHINKSFIKTQSFQSKVDDLLKSSLIGKEISIIDDNKTMLFGKVFLDTKNTFLIMTDNNPKHLKKVIKFRKQAILIDGLVLPLKLFLGTLSERISKVYYIHI